ncbi:hypothetical protein C8Q79DRAFT_320471 [Trametes meyenii]|nr:hypothetical protein C8Q79DRAFT_320471 [Trametes meyenii]
MTMAPLLAARLLLPRGRVVSPRVLQIRTIGTTPTSSYKSRTFGLRRLAVLGLASGAVLGVSAFTYDARAGIAAAQDVREKGRVQGSSASGRPPTPLTELLRSYVVFSFCSVPKLVEWAPGILAAFTAVPGLRQATEGMVRATFFDQFVGGDSAEEALPLIERLRTQNTGCLFAYSVEVDEAEASGHAKEHERDAAAGPTPHQQVVDETLHCIDVAADFEDRYTKGLVGRRTWVAIKLSAMIADAESLRRFSKYLLEHRPQSTPPVAFPGRPFPTDLDVLETTPKPGDELTAADINSLRELRQNLVTICTRAKGRGVRLIFDAEYSWYEP